MDKSISNGFGCYPDKRDEFLDKSKSWIDKSKPKPDFSDKPKNDNLDFPGKKPIPFPGQRRMFHVCF
jgi:hypothetical protein